jgi:hypothetical protein
VEPETARVYEELPSHETQFGIGPETESPSKKECRKTRMYVGMHARVCVCVRLHAYRHYTD